MSQEDFSFGNPSIWMVVFTTATVTMTLGLYVKKFFLPSNEKVFEDKDLNEKNQVNDGSTAEKEVMEEASKYPGGDVTICFGSQTGTAEGFAKTLAEEGKIHGFNTRLLDLEDFDSESIQKEKCLILLLATYGEGEPTDNAVDFIKFLKNKKKDLCSSSFSSVSYTVFGLGNRQYEHYNAMGKLVDQKLEKYGGKRIYAYGEGDDDKSLEDDFERWKESLWIEFRKVFLPDEKEENETVVNKLHGVNPTFNYKIVNSDYPQRNFSNHEIQNSTSHYFNCLTVSIIKNEEIRQNNIHGSTLHIELDISNSDISYTTADNLAILPDNDHLAVKKTADLLGYNLSDTFILENISPNDVLNHPFPTPCTIEKALTEYIDLGHAPMRSLLLNLAFYATHEEEKNRLLYLSSKEGRDEYKHWITESRRTVVDVLCEFKSFQIPFDHFLYMMPHLQPRYYTISSSHKVHPKSIHVTVSIISEALSDGRIFQGICTNYLLKHKKYNNSNDAKLLRVFVRPSSFVLPLDPSKPILMIGPGTGIAPMRAFLQERAYQKQQGLSVGKTILYFGCKSKTSDFIYQNELQTYHSENILNEFYTAFSRDQDKKVYVQHLLKENEKAVWSFITKEGGYIYVCGLTKMGHDVFETMKNIILTYGQKEMEWANQFLKDLQSSGRYVQELWSE